jgi:hypothetical protein
MKKNGLARSPSEMPTRSASNAAATDLKQTVMGAASHPTAHANGVA